MPVVIAMKVGGAIRAIWAIEEASPRIWVSLLTVREYREGKWRVSVERKATRNRTRALFQYWFMGDNDVFLPLSKTTWINQHFNMYNFIYIIINEMNFLT